MQTEANFLGRRPGLQFFVILSFLFTGLWPKAQNLDYTYRSSSRPQKNTYYFLHTFKMTKGPVHQGRQMIIDDSGHLVYYRFAKQATDFKLHANGKMSFFSAGTFYLMDERFRIYDSVNTVNGIKTDSHDLIILPNGNYLLMGTETIIEDLSMHKIFKNKTQYGSRRARVKYNVIQELDQNKRLVAEWKSRKYFRVQDADTWFRHDTLDLDAAHFNSIEQDMQGNYVISARYFNEVFKVDPRADKMIWRCGGPHNNMRVTNDSVPFMGQHDARIQKGNRMTLFDNAYGGIAPMQNARALEYMINDSSRTATLVWRYDPPVKIISEAAGNAQRLSDGNTLISYGLIQKGTPNITFEIITPRGEAVKALSFKDTIGTYRTFCFTSDSIPTQQPQIKISNAKTGFYLEPIKEFESYQWSTGETSRKINVTRPGKYCVYVPIGAEGFISSKFVTFVQKDFTNKK